jgi:hypothetical protein
LDYIIEKTGRENEKEKKEEARKAEREVELARLRAAQEKVADKHAQQDALRARRAYEAYEREWRRKEKDTAEKHTQQEEELKFERGKQQLAREAAIAVEAHKMKKEFFETLQRQKEEALRSKELEKIAHHKNRTYALEVQVLIK